MKKSEKIHFNPEILFKHYSSPSPNHIKKRKSSKFKEKKPNLITKKLQNNLAKFNSQRNSKFKSKSFDPFAPTEVKPNTKKKITIKRDSNEIKKNDLVQKLSNSEIKKINKLKNKKSLAQLFKPTRSISPNFSTRRLVSYNMKEKFNKSEIMTLIKNYKKDFFNFNNSKCSKYCFKHQDRKALHCFKFQDIKVFIGICTSCKINMASLNFVIKDLNFNKIKKNSGEKEKDLVLRDIDKEIKNYENLQNKRIRQLVIDKKQYEDQKKKIDQFFKRVIDLFNLKKKLYFENFEFSYLKEKNYLELLKNLISRNLKDLNSLKTHYINNKNEKSIRKNVIKKINYFKEIGNTCKFTKLDVFPDINILSFCKKLNNHYENLWSKFTYKPKKNEKMILEGLEKEYEIYNYDKDTNTNIEKNKNENDENSYTLMEFIKKENISKKDLEINKDESLKLLEKQFNNFENEIKNKEKDQLENYENNEVKNHQRSFKSISSIKGSFKSLKEFENKFDNKDFKDMNPKEIPKIDNDFMKKNNLFNFKKNNQEVNNQENNFDLQEIYKTSETKNSDKDEISNKYIKSYNLDETFENQESFLNVYEKNKS